MSPGSAAFARYEQFLRQELPSRVREQLHQELERELQPVEERVRSRLQDIVRLVQRALSQAFRSSGEVGVIPEVGFAIEDTISEDMVAEHDPASGHPRDMSNIPYTAVDLPNLTLSGEEGLAPGHLGNNLDTRHPEVDVFEMAFAGANSSNWESAFANVDPTELLSDLPGDAWLWGNEPALSNINSHAASDSAYGSNSSGFRGSVGDLSGDRSAK